MDRYMDFREVQKYLKTTKSTLYRLVQTKKIPAVKVGNQWRFKKERLDKCLELNENIKTK